MSPSKPNKRHRDRSERQLTQLRKDLGIRTLDEVKQDEITRVLVLAKGDRVLTAALLGIGKTTVYRSVAKERKWRSISSSVKKSGKSLKSPR